MTSPFDANLSLKRTPKKTTIEEDLMQSTPKNPMEIDDNSQLVHDEKIIETPGNSLKRMREEDDVEREVSMQDVMNVLMELKQNQSELNRKQLEQSAQTSEIASGIHQITNSQAVLINQIDGIENKLGEVKQNVVSLDARVNHIDERMAKVENDSLKNSKLINSLMQNKLERGMEMTGIKQELFKTHKDMKQLAKMIIESFKIDINEGDIESAYSRSVMATVNGKQASVNIIIVTFRSLAIKIRIMSEKMKTSNSHGIYFNIALTPMNRFLMRNAKRITKTLKLKCFFAGGKIKVVKLDKTILAVETEDDLKAVEDYVMAQSTASTSSIASCSTNRD